MTAPNSIRPDGGTGAVEAVPDDATGESSDGTTRSESRGKQVLERLESETWSSANDLTTAATIRAVNDYTCYRHEHDLLVVTERQFTRTLSEAERSAHDFDSYRTDPEDRHEHDPNEFTDRSIQYLLSEPSWHTCSSCSGDGQTECGECDGDGIVSCTPCRGTGERTCTDCQGSGIGDVPCPRCNGNGVVDGTYEEYEVCPECNGTETVRRDNACSNCEGDGVVECGHCSGDGEANCSNCDDGVVTCESCDGGGRVQKFDVLERSYEHQRQSTFASPNVPRSYLTDAEGTVVKTWSREHPHENVLRYRVSTAELEVTNVEYTYNGDSYEAYEIEGEELKTPSYPQNTLRKYAPYLTTITASLVLALLVLVL